MALFDVYIFIDWGASNRPYPSAPSKDAPWVGEMSQGERGPHETYHRTRHSATEDVLKRLLHYTGLGCRVLVGFDFPYGYPKRLSSALNLPVTDQPWRAVWIELSRRIQDEGNNLNNRFQVASDLNYIINASGKGPFWGCHAHAATDYLGPRSPGFPFHAANNTNLERLRVCEKKLPRVQEVWGLYGQGRVGSQALTGIPRLAYLRWHHDLKTISRIWPFETGFTTMPSVEKGPCVVHVEIWLGVVGKDVAQMKERDPQLIHDQAQVRAMCRWARHLDDNNALGPLFDTPAGLDDAQVKSCADEEGWILGA